MAAACRCSDRAEQRRSRLTSVLHSLKLQQGSETKSTFMMNALFLVVLCVGLCYAHSEISIEPLMDHVVVLKVPPDVRPEVRVPLVCRKDDQTQSVFWKKDGIELKPALQGNHVNVLVEETDGGNFSCHLTSDGQYLNHTVVFVQLDAGGRHILQQKSQEEGHIRCSAHNYTGLFHCSWTRTDHKSNAAVLRVQATRKGRMLACELEATGSGVQCQDNSCPYEEEQDPILLTIHIHSYYRMEAYTKSFFLREIVRPAALPNLHKNEANVFSWSYPDSWQKPCPFYGLNFQVRVVRHGPCDSDAHVLKEVNNTEDTKFEVAAKAKKYVFCVRAQDRYTRGPFSPWSGCSVNKQEADCQPLSP